MRTAAIATLVVLAACACSRREPPARPETPSEPPPRPLEPGHCREAWEDGTCHLTGVRAVRSDGGRAEFVLSYQFGDTAYRTEIGADTDASNESAFRQGLVTQPDVHCRIRLLRAPCPESVLDWDLVPPDGPPPPHPGG